MATVISGVGSLVGKVAAGQDPSRMLEVLKSDLLKPDVLAADKAALGIPDAAAGTGATAGPGAFESVLADAVGRVETFQADSHTMMSQFLSGADVDLHQVALSVQKAETAFELFAEVRNKVVQAYQEIMRTQI